MSLYFLRKNTISSILKIYSEELKPFIDKKYSIYKNQENTIIGGSSMGALLSVNAICEYPNVFGCAACLSPHWPGIAPNKNTFFPDIMLIYLDKKAPSNKNHNFYFDHGEKRVTSFMSKSR